MTDGRRTLEVLFQNRRVFENIGDEAHTFMRIEPPLLSLLKIFARNDPRGFLATMLEGVQTVVGHDGGLGMVEDSEDAAVAAGFSFDPISFVHGAKVRKKAGANKIDGVRHISNLLTNIHIPSDEMTFRAIADICPEEKSLTELRSGFIRSYSDLAIV